MDTTIQRILHVARRCRYTKALICNVILETGLVVDSQFDRLDRGAQSGVEFCSVLVVSVVSRVVNVFLECGQPYYLSPKSSWLDHLWSIDPQTFFGDLKFSSRVAKAEEREHPNQDSYGIGLTRFQSTDIELGEGYRLHHARSAMLLDVRLENSP